ncbi:MAG: DUF4923 family protein [Pseudomonadota bacterium]
MVGLLHATLAGGGELALVDYRDPHIAASVPKGWATSRIISDQMLYVEEDRDDAEGSALLLRRSPGTGVVDPESVQLFLGQLLQSKIISDGSPESLDEHLTLHRFRASDRNVSIAMLTRAEPARGSTVIGFLVATNERYADFDGDALIRRVVESVGRADAAATKAPASTSTASALVGHWVVSNKDLNLFSGPVAVALGGAATRAQVTSNLSQSAWGTKLTYAFNADGSYEAHYKGLAVFGVMRSDIETIETGRFRFDGVANRLTLSPHRYRGTISVGHQANKEPLDEANLPQRRYRVGLDGNVMVLIGPCGDFQIEPYCGTSKQPNPSATFPLVRELR